MSDQEEQRRRDTMAQRPMTDAAKASTAGYAWNPVSGRFVKKSGPTYLRLIKCGVLTDPNLFVVQRAAPDPAPAPAQGRRREALAPPQRDEAEQYSDDDDNDNDLAARIAELLRKSKGRSVKPPTRLPRARIVVAPPARASARGSGRRQIADLFDTSTDMSESECG